MPEPFVVAVAAALAGKSAGSLYDLVRRKFADRRAAREALAAATGAAPESAEVADLAEHLERAALDDPSFATALHKHYTQVVVTREAHDGSVINEVSGVVTGNVIQAQRIEGGITLHPPQEDSTAPSDG